MRKPSKPVPREDLETIMTKPCRKCGSDTPELEIFPGQICLSCHAKAFDAMYSGKPLPKPDFRKAVARRPA